MSASAAGATKAVDLAFDEGGDDLFLSPRQMRALLHGDRAVVLDPFVDATFREGDPAFDLPAFLVPTVGLSYRPIQQVVFNILDNGAQAMWEQGDDHPKPKFTVTLDKEEHWACVAIADNGPGMATEIRKRIFEPFYTTKPTGSGTGLGLSIAYFIITENHAGRLSVESSPGQGTTFTIKLPLIPRP